MLRFRRIEWITRMTYVLCAIEHAESQRSEKVTRRQITSDRTDTEASFSCITIKFSNCKHRTFQELADIIQLWNVVGRVSTELLKECEVHQVLVTRVLLVQFTQLAVDLLPRFLLIVCVCHHGDLFATTTCRL